MFETSHFKIESLQNGDIVCLNIATSADPRELPMFGKVMESASVVNPLTNQPLTAYRVVWYDDLKGDIEQWVPSIDLQRVMSV